MQRQTERVKIDAGEVSVKACRYGTIEKRYVEYESAAQIAKESGQSLDEIYRKVYAKIDRMSKMQKMQEN